MINRRSFLIACEAAAAAVALAGCQAVVTPVTQPTTLPVTQQQWLNDLAFAQTVVNFAAVVIPFLPNVADQTVANAALKLTTDAITAAETAISSGETPATIAQLIAVMVQDAKNLMTTPQVVTAHAAVVSKAQTATK